MAWSWRKNSSCIILAVQIGSVVVLLYLIFTGRLNYNSTNGDQSRRGNAELKQLRARNNMLHQNVRSLSNKLQKLGIDLRGEKSRGTAMKEKKEATETDYGGVELDGCEVIHIAMVVSGSTTVKRFAVVVKSILFHSKNFIHFHLLTDTKGESILSTIFYTWLIPRVNVSFYSLSDAIKIVKDIPTSHYSGIYAMTKLILPSILPDTLRNVLFLDSDLIVTDDIGHLWSILKTMKKRRKLLGLVENQSDWYLNAKYKPWPAIGRGFNSGVMLLDLKLMRERDWKKIWQTAAKEGFVKHDKTQLADQDIINAAAKREGNIVHILPCVWNVQLSERTLSDNCYKASHHFKIVHWNSAAKLDVENVHGEYFRNQYSMIANLNSNLFRTYISDCPSWSSSRQPEDQEGEDPCFEFRNAANFIYKVHPFYLDFSYKSKSTNDVTLVAQMSMDRLHMLEPLCKQWDGPLSISLYASDADLDQLNSLISSSPLLKSYKKLALHVVFRQGKYFPVNILRNVALHASSTPYVFLSDIDFLPRPDLYEYTKEAVRVLGGSRRALVIPAFESLLYRTKLPANKSELISMLDKKEVFSFRYHVWKDGHAPTNFEHWKGTHRPYKVTWAENFEPYVVVQRNVTPYDERFIGFGWNKVSHIMELNYQGYEFIVLPDAYILHMPHAPSADIATFRRRKTYRDCMQLLKREFRKELNAKYKTKQSSIVG